jgi:hypothetical protein
MRELSEGGMPVLICSRKKSYADILFEHLKTLTDFRGFPEALALADGGQEQDGRTAPFDWAGLLHSRRPSGIVRSLFEFANSTARQGAPARLAQSYAGEPRGSRLIALTRDLRCRLLEIPQLMNPHERMDRPCIPEGNRYDG